MVKIVVGGWKVEDMVLFMCGNAVDDVLLGGSTRRYTVQLNVDGWDSLHSTPLPIHKREACCSSGIMECLRPLTSH